jgi:hypothetical protein
MKSILLAFCFLCLVTVAFSQVKPIRKIRVYLPDFKTFIIDTIYDGVPAKIDFRSDHELKKFRTAIRAGYKTNKLNFAGHYCLVYWGCGSPCKQSAIVDLRTGKVYDGPTSSYGYKFKKNSKMIIVNPPGDDNLLDDYLMASTPEVWVLNEHTKKFYPKKVKYSPQPHFGPREDD